MKKFVARPISKPVGFNGRIILIGYIVDKVEVIEKIIHKNADTDETIKTTYLVEPIYSSSAKFEVSQIYENQHTCQADVYRMNHEYQVPRFTIEAMRNIKDILDEEQVNASHYWGEDHTL